MFYVNENGNIVEAECEECGRILKFRKNTIQYHPENHTYTLPEPIECFCENSSDVILNVPQAGEPVNQQAYQQARNVPRCPTCGSENIKKISLTSKAVGGYFFGIFSSNIHNTYRCLNCGYKW